LAQSCITQFAVLEDYEFRLVGDLIRRNICRLSTGQVRLSDVFSANISEMKETHVRRQIASYKGRPPEERLDRYMRKLQVEVPGGLRRKFAELAQERNSLAHGVEQRVVTHEAARNYFSDCILVAKLLGATLGDQAAIDYQFPWIPSDLVVEFPDWSGLGTRTPVKCGVEPALHFLKSDRRPLDSQN
jgi:hypothetical protein